MSRILTICPYKLLPPRSGGALRCFHLFRQISRYHELHAVIFQKYEELQQGIDGYDITDSTRIYSPVDHPPPLSFFDKLPQGIGPTLLFRILRRSWRGPADSTLLQCYHLLKEILTKYKIDVVIFEHISSMHAAPFVKRLSPTTIRILDAHNVDHILLEKEMNSKSKSNTIIGGLHRSYRRTLWIEHHLTKFVNTFWACSDEDRRVLESINGLTGFTIPNGVDTVSFPFDSDLDKFNNKNLIFCGSLKYHANIEGIKWFHQEIWPAIKAEDTLVRLKVIGRGGDQEAFHELRTDPHVDFIGEVDDVRRYYRNTGVAIVPILTGSGTRLKILEAMSLGNPVVSTPIGAEGLTVTDGKNILFAESPKIFAAAVLRLLSGQSLFESIRVAARKLVETYYDWSVIGLNTNQALQQILSSKFC